VEAFWSPSAVPAPAKLAAGAALAVVTALYLSLAGRPRPGAA
jgi:hypothetical protein